MGYFELDIYVESFEPDSDGFVRVPRSEVEETYAAGDLVTITDDEVLGFARVVSVDGDAASGFITLEVLAEGLRIRPRSSWSSSMTSGATYSMTKPRSPGWRGRQPIRSR